MKSIPINSATHGVKEVLVDDEDYYWLADYQWSLSKQRDGSGFYAVTQTSRKNPPRRIVIMHRLIMGVDGMDGSIQVDHINHNKLDNRRENLRICNNSENHKNARSWGSSKYLGVSFNKASGKWLSKIIIDGKHTSIGLYPNTACGELLAAVRYDEYAIKYHKEFANPNFKSLW